MGAVDLSLVTLKRLRGVWAQKPELAWKKSLCIYTDFGKSWGVFWWMGASHICFSQAHREETRVCTKCVWVMCVDFPRKILKSTLDGLDDELLQSWHHEEGLTDNGSQPTVIRRVPTDISPAAVFF